MTIGNQKRLELSGKRFGRLTAVKPSGVNKYKNILWLCACDCGKSVIVKGASLKNGNTSSCGCLHRERAGKNLKTHGLTKTPEYTAWTAMKQRCYYPKNRHYADYGGRGITVCDRWKDSFENFRSDMGLKPSPKHSLDRIDVNGNYSPENTRWANNQTQASNRRDNRYLIKDGKTQTVSEWSRELGIPLQTLLARLRRGWDAERALTPA